ncbi:hypothetical protein BC835DRAFT_1517547 [Cytidiella melzeri]|nr:hypothetical protein BC835DRAFT_1517547 [Cytidiella melzeri]
MRFALAAVLVVASTVSAVSLQARQASFPNCALSCVTNPPNLFGCDASDNTCLCNSAPYVAATTQCIESACSASDAASAEALSRQLCAAVGVTLTSTPSASSTAPATASSTPSTSVTSASSGSSSTAPAPSSSASSGSSSANSASSSAPAPTVSTTSGATSAAFNVALGAAAVVFAAVVNL